jgi:hypothetical protein
MGLSPFLRMFLEDILQKNRDKNLIQRNDKTKSKASKKKSQDIRPTAGLGSSKSSLEFSRF